MNSKAIRKQLLAAVAMVLVAAVALGSSTYAWFAAQNEVTATGMQLQAQGETGIVIKSAENTQSKWATTASAAMSESVKLKPTSTQNLTSWWHAVSDEKDNAKAQQTAANAYTDVTASKSEYVLMRSFYIRSAAQAVPVSDVKLAIKTVSAATVGETATSENLDKSIRVGVKLNTGGSGSEYYVYAPLADGDFSLVAKYDSNKTLTEKREADATTDQFALSGNAVPVNDTGLLAEIYMWFEGEDENCKSSNITASLDNLKVSVVFTTVSTTTGGTQQPADNRIDLTADTVSLAESATEVGGKTYYKISGATTTDSKVIYSDTKPLASTSKIYTADNDTNPTSMTEIENASTIFKLPSGT